MSESGKNRVAARPMQKTRPLIGRVDTCRIMEAARLSNSVYQNNDAVSPSELSSQIFRSGADVTLLLSRRVPN
jgi:hypothetical protein